MTAEPESIDTRAGCVFCAMVAGAEPASVVHEGEAVLAILTIGPVTPGHILLLPKRHAAFVADLDEETGAHLFRVGMRLAAALRRSGLRCEGVNWFLADGAAALRKVFRDHLHVFPVYADDSFCLDTDWSRRSARRELDAIAAQIHAAGV